MSGRSGLVVVYDQAVMNVNKTMNKRMHGLYCQEKTPASQGGTILTVGDGDFSFSLSLATELDLRGTEKSNRLVATSYDPLSQVVAKYPSSTMTLNQLARQGVCVLHSVDATSLPQSVSESLARAIASRRPGFSPPRTGELLGKCSRIIFNFPHLGGGTQDDVDANKAVLRDFFATLTPLLTEPVRGASAPLLPLTTTRQVALNKGYTAGEDACVDADSRLGGQVHVSLRTSTFYQSWQLVELAQEQGFRLLRTAPFIAQHYPGYQEQRTQPGTMRALPPPAQGALIFIFVRVPRGQELTGEEVASMAEPAKVKRSVRKAIARQAAAAAAAGVSADAVGEGVDAVDSEGDYEFNDDEFDDDSAVIAAPASAPAHAPAPPAPASKSGPRLMMRAVDEAESVAAPPKSAGKGAAQSVGPGKAKESSDKNGAASASAGKKSASKAAAPVLAAPTPGSVPADAAALLSRLSGLPPKSKDARVLAQKARDAAAAAGAGAVAAVAAQIKAIMGAGTGSGGKRSAPTPAPAPAPAPRSADAMSGGKKVIPPLKAEAIPSIEDIKERKRAEKISIRGNVVETIDIDMGLQQAFASEQAKAAERAAQKAAKKAANRAQRMGGGQQMVSTAVTSDLFHVRPSK